MARDKKHQVTFTDQMWEDLVFFTEVLGFRNTSNLVHSAVIEYCRQHVPLIQMARKEKTDAS